MYGMCSWRIARKAVDNGTYSHADSCSPCICLLHNRQRHHLYRRACPTSGELHALRSRDLNAGRIQKRDPRCTSQELLPKLQHCLPYRDSASGALQTSHQPSYHSLELPPLAREHDGGPRATCARHHACTPRHSTFTKARCTPAAKAPTPQPSRRPGCKINRQPHLLNTIHVFEGHVALSRPPDVFAAQQRQQLLDDVHAQNLRQRPCLRPLRQLHLVVKHLGVLVQQPVPACTACMCTARRRVSTCKLVRGVMSGAARVTAD